MTKQGAALKRLETAVAVHREHAPIDTHPQFTNDIETVCAALRAAKAPQDTHSLAEAIANELMSQNMLDVTVEQATFVIQRVLEAGDPYKNMTSEEMRSKLLRRG
jgi:hypothetical protein